MMQLHDLDVRHLKDIPGYKAILKAVIKSQIQQLVEQLSDHTGEESILLTASVSDGTLCNMGSVTGKTFLDGRDEIKSQFLRHCLKRSQKKRQQEEDSGGGGESDSNPDSYSGAQIPQNMPHQSRVHPVSLTKVTHGASFSEGRGRPGEAQKRTFTSPMRQDHHSPMKQGRLLNLPPESLPSSSYSDIPLSPSQRSPATSTAPTSRSSQGPSHIQKIDLSQQNVKLEDSSFTEGLDINSQESGYRDRGGTSDTSSSQPEQSFTEPSPADRQALETEISNLISSMPASESSNSGVDPVNVKIEPITEGEMELEITGVEMAGNSDSFSGDGNWNRLGYGSGADNESGSNQDNQSRMGYISQQGATNASSRQRSKYKNWFQVPRPHICQYCGRTWTSLQDRIKHERTHTGERPFVCLTCGKSFSTMSSLYRHIRSQGHSQS